jgi:hypothetical protein
MAIGFWLLACKGLWVVGKDLVGWKLWAIGYWLLASKD